MMARILQIGGLLVSIGLLVVGQGVHKGEHVARAAEAPELQTFTLQIDGMTCGGCVKDVRAGLLKVPGVRGTEFQLKKKWFFFHDYSDARVIVTCDAGTSVNALIKAVESTSTPLLTYKARQIE